MRPSALLLVLALTACGAPLAQAHAPNAGGAQALAARTYQNPVLDADFPDPMVLRAADGTYWAYGTQGPHGGRDTNVPVYTSRDMVSWTFRGDAMPTKPAWARDTQNFWAPHVLQDGDRFYLYFSGERNGRRGHGVGVAVAGSPAGPFVGDPEPIVAGDGFVNIDPMPFDDPATGRKLLYWGSGFEPIKVRELAPDRRRFAPGSRMKAVLPTSDRPYERLIEGAWVHRRDGWYYLFYSGDDCCGDPPKYVTMVARSRSAEGPFEKQQDATNEGTSVILGDGPRWKGAGHNALVTDAKGQDWLVYHARDERQPFLPGGKQVRRPLLIDRLHWEGGWPWVADDHGSEGRLPAPVTR